MSFLRAAALAVAFVAPLSACTSADFNTAPSGPADDSGTGSDTSGTDGGGVDPCAPVEAVAKFCITVGKVDTHPAYDGTTGADILGIDGIGGMKVYLYKEDPGDPTKKAVAPILSIAYPSGGATLDVDKDLPRTITSSAPEGEYWFTVVFEDSAATRPDTYAAVPGDFIVVPPVVDNKLVFPKINLKQGETQTVPVSLKPIRQVTVTMQATLALSTKAKLADSTIHGDGPLAFVLYTGKLAETPVFADLAYVHCIDLHPKVAPTIPVSFGTLVAGHFNMLGVLFDYDYPSAKGLGNDFPGRGSITSPYADGTVDKVATVDIPAEKWVATGNVNMTDVPFAPSGIPEAFTCPGAK